MNVLSCVKLRRLLRDYELAVAKSEAATTRRASLPPGSSRASVTTANARWMRAAEARDRTYTTLRNAMLAALSEAP